MSLEYYYHEHTGGECQQGAHPTGIGCPDNSVSFDCQENSEGFCACFHIIETDSALRHEHTHSPTAWDLNGLVMDYHGYIPEPSRRPRPPSLRPADVERPRPPSLRPADVERLVRALRTADWRDETLRAAARSGSDQDLLEAITGLLASTPVVHNEGGGHENK